MRIKSLQVENFRGFLGEHSIEFASTDNENVTLILAENEVGKSTLLNAFVWCFYGRVTEDTDRANELVHDEATNNRAHVSIEVEENDQVYLFKRLVENSKETFKAWEVDDIGDIKPIHYPESLIKTFLPPALSDYFLFNGEGLKDIIKDPHALKKSIKDIQGLTAAVAAKESINKHKTALNAESNRANSKNRKLDEKRKLLRESILNYERFKKKLKTAEADQELADKAFKAAQKIWDKVKSFDAKKLKADEIKSKNTIKGFDSDIKNLESQRRSLIPNYGIDIMGFPFVANAKDHLSEASEKGYPSQYHKQIIEDSLEENKCKLCERPFEKNDSIRKLLTTKVAIAVDDNLQDRIHKTRASIREVDNSIMSFVEELNDIDIKISSKLQKKVVEVEVLEEIQASIKEIAGKDTEVEDAEKEYKNCYSSQRKAATTVGTIKANLESLKYEKDKLDGEIIRAEAEANPASSLVNEVKFLDNCIESLDELIIDQEKSGRDFIFNDMNESLQRHSKGNHQFGFEKDIHGVETYNPVILKSDGKTTVKLSTGAKKLKKNLFFITSLIKHSKMRSKASGSIQIPGTIAPLVVDAPFSDLDEFNIQIAARVLLESSDQLIVMISSSSFNGGFLNVLNDDKKFKNRLGKAYILKKYFKGSKSGKSALEVDAFGSKIETAIYESNNETSGIEEIELGR
jgi:DNA sulfur modification protein DndD